MKRPFACLGLGALAALAAAAAFPSFCFSACVICAAFAAVVFVLSKPGTRNTKSAAVVLIGAAIAFLYYGAAARAVKAHVIDEFGGQTVELSGVITSAPYTKGQTTSFIVKTNEINGVKKRVNIRFSVNSVPNGTEYDFIRARAELEPVSDDGEFGLGYTSYSDARRIFLSTYIGYDKETYYSVTENEFPPVLRYFSDIRRSISDVFAKYLSYDEASLCTAMITGDKNMLTNSVRSQFKTLGLSHLLVVSGLHMSIIAAFLYVTAKRIFKNAYLAAFVEFIGIAAFALITGFGFSVCRAFLMCSLIILARVFHSKTDALNSLGIAAALMSLDPFCAGDIGLLWSFSSVFAIITLTDRIKQKLFGKSDDDKKRYSGFAELVSAALAAFVGSLPFIVLVTKEFSPYFLAANILTVPVTGVVLICGGISALLISCGFVSAGTLFIFISGIAAKYILYVTELICSLPFASVDINRTVVIMWFLITVSLLAAVFLLWYFKGSDVKNYIRIVCVSSAAVICAMTGADILINGDTITLAAQPASGGMTVMLYYDDTAAVLYASGDKSKFYETEDLLPHNGSITFLVDLPQSGYDRIRRILREHDAQTVITHESSADKFAWYEYTGGSVKTIACEGELSLFENGTMELYTDGDMSCEYITINGTTVLIADGEGVLPDKFRSPDIAVLCQDHPIYDLSDQTEKTVCGEGESLNLRFN